MTALPLASDFTGPVTEGDFKAAMTNQRDYLAGLFGTDGTAATGLATVGALGAGYVAKTAAYTVVTADRGKVINATSGTWTLTLPASSGLTGFSFALRNTGTGVVTIDPNAAELIDGATTQAVAAGGAVIVICTGTAWTTFGQNPGIGRPGTDLLAFSTAGLEAFRVSAAQNLLIGSAADLLGVGASRITSLGDTFATGQWAVSQFTNNNIAPRIVGAKSRGATVGTYTILTAADQIFNIDAWGADGTTMVFSARIQAYNIGTPAAGDIRGGWRLQTGSGAGVVTTRLTIDDTTIAATLPITTTGYLTGGFNAHTAGTLALAFGSKDHCSVTPNATGSFTTTVPPAGTKCSLIVNTSGVTSFTMTFGTGFKSTGTLATGTVTAKTFTISFISDGTSVIETGRTVAM